MITPDDVVLIGERAARGKRYQSISDTEALQAFRDREALLEMIGRVQVLTGQLEAECADYMSADEWTVRRSVTDRLRKIVGPR